MSETDELRPCPFCGARAVSYPYEQHRGEALIECQGCQARMSDIDEPQLIEAWNRRALPTPSPQ